MNKMLIAVIAIILLILGGLGLYKLGNSSAPATNSSSSGANNTGSNSATSSQSTTTATVRMVNMLFTPSQVTIDKGTKVTWINDDNTTHTVIADKGVGPNSGNISPGTSYSYVFNQSGSYQYHCSIHSAMHGTIVVR